MPYIFWRGRRRWIDDDDEESSESYEETSTSSLSDSETSTSSLSSFSDSDLSSEPYRDPTNCRFASRQQPPMKKATPKPLKTLLGNDLTIPKKRKITLDE